MIEAGQPKHAHYIGRVTVRTVYCNHRGHDAGMLFDAQASGEPMPVILAGRCFDHKRRRYGENARQAVIVFMPHATRVRDVRGTPPRTPGGVDRDKNSSPSLIEADEGVMQGLKAAVQRLRERRVFPFLAVGQLDVVEYLECVILAIRV